MNYYEKLICKYYRKKDKVTGWFIENKLKKDKLQYGLYTKTDRTEKIILSMASYKARYPSITLALKSLILQEVKADRIIVWLDKEVKENEITKEMKELEKYGVEYRFTEDGLCPHNKYFYAMKEFPDDCIITVDDDVIYSPDLIRKLIQYHTKYPDAVCARRVHKITFDKKGRIKPYMQWKYEYRRGGVKPSFYLCATGCGGILYPPHVLPLEAFNIKNIKEYCLYADDIWLKTMELLNKKKVIWVKNNYVMPREILDSQKVNLNKTNVAGGNNDIYLKNLMKLYPDAFHIFHKQNKN